ncbi:MAG: hypothetical protein WHS46_03230 [Desulfosoma sp.]
MDNLTPIVNHAGGHADLATQMRLHGGQVVANPTFVRFPLDDPQKKVGEDGDEKVPLDPA